MAAAKKKARHSSLLSKTTSVPSSPIDQQKGVDVPDRHSSPNLWRNTLQKSPRPASFLGSWKSFNSVNEEDERLIRTESNPTSLDEATSPTTNDMEHMSLLYHGEVQIAGSMFRKKIQYMVLTNTHLLRFKSRNKAAEVFPEIPASMGRTSSINHLRMSSGGSTSESHSGSDPHTSIPLHHIVAVYKLDDGRPYFSIELASYDEYSNSVFTQSMQLHDPHDSEVWLSSLYNAIAKAKVAKAAPPCQQAVEYAARCLESEGDYDPNHFSMFTVAQRTSKHGPRSSSDDLGKLVSSVCYLVIGLHKVHLLPLPRPMKSGSSTSIAEMSTTSHAIVTITAINVQEHDNAFHIAFRMPFQAPVMLYLASTSVTEVALYVRNAIDYLRPLWVEQPLDWRVPNSLDDAILPIPPVAVDDHFAFDRTLTAYCVGYNLDPSNIRYTVSSDCEDAPEFSLLEPNNPRRPTYSSLELLAVLRALRYNESFHSFAFRRTKLDSLHNVYDKQGSEHFTWSTRSGQVINKLPRLDQTPLLVQELQCLLLKSCRLRRVDFSDCITRKAADIHDNDRGSGICEAVFPMCALQVTNADWITLNGIAMSMLDIQYIHGATSKKDTHFRAVELARCGLDENSVEYAVNCLGQQESTLECLDLSNNPCKLNPSLLREHLGKFYSLRKLNLSRLALSFGSQPILSSGVLNNWKLEFLDLSFTVLNTESVDGLAVYLMSEKSSLLRQLHIENCQMSGEDVATLLESMYTNHARPRNLHLFVSGNRLERGHGKLVRAIARSNAPTHVTMQALEYNEGKSFRNLLQALSENNTIEYLDLSRVSIPFEASAEACETLRFVFEKNTALRELDISGEQAHLEAVTLGRGIVDAVRGLESNETLEILRIENQALGFPGASALASMLQINTSLRELHCEGNEISLQAFTTLVNAMMENRSLIYLPAMMKDRAWSRSKVDREINNLLSPTGSSSSVPARNSVRRAISNSLPGARSARILDKPQPQSKVSEQDVRAAVSSLEEMWEGEIDRLAGYLARNYSLASGMPLNDISNAQEDQGSRPTTAGTLATAIKNAMLDRTPTAELDRQLGDMSLSESSGSSTVREATMTENTVPEEEAQELEDEVELEEGITMRQ